jgi:hypothetical protein
MKLLENKYLHFGLFALLVIIVTVLCAKRGPISEKYKANTYDAQMWTSASITSYHMFFKNYVRPTKELDNWFPTYAWKKGVNVFTGDSAMINPYTGVNQYRADTLKFPYDQITITGKNQQYALAVKYDTTKFPRKDFQWFDRAGWTFGWKAPNFGKYVMGWWIQTFAHTKPDPKGYFEFVVPTNLNNPDSGTYLPSKSISPAPYSYAPVEYERLARQPNIFMTLMVVIIVIITGWFFYNFWVGFTAGLWLILNKTFIDVNCAVGLDSFAVTLSALAFLLLLFTVRSIQKNGKWWQILLWGAGTGLASALALSSKLNAGMVLITEGFIFGIMGVVALWNGYKLKAQPTKVRFTPLLKTLVAGALTAVVCLFIFIRLNPQVQKQPKQRIAAMRSSIDDYFDRRARIFTSNQITDRLKAINAEIIAQSKLPNANQQALMNLYGQLNATGKSYNEESQRYALKENEFHLKKSERYLKDLAKLEKEIQKLNPNFEPKTNFTNWVKVKHSWPVAFNLVAKRIAMVDPENPDRYYGTFGSLLKVRYNFLDGFFALLGILFCLFLAWKQWKQKKQFYTYGILVVSLVFIVYGNVDFVWQDWPRYMTPIFPLYSLTIAIGMVETTKLIRQKLAERKQKIPTPTANTSTKKTGK